MQIEGRQNEQQTSNGRPVGQPWNNFPIHIVENDDAIAFALDTWCVATDSKSFVAFSTY